MRGWPWQESDTPVEGQEQRAWIERLAHIRSTLQEARAGVQEALAKQNEAEARLSDVQARLAALLAEAELENPH